MNFFCFRFSLNQKYQAGKVFHPIAAKSSPKISPLEKTVQKSLSQCKIVKKLHSVEEGLLMQYHSINIEKLQKQIKKVSNIP